MLRCLGEHETTMVLAEVHNGACNSHIGEKALTHKLLWAGVLLAYSNERYHRLCKEVRSMLETC